MHSTDQKAALDLESEESVAEGSEGSEGSEDKSESDEQDEKEHHEPIEHLLKVRQVAVISSYIVAISGQLVGQFCTRILYILPGIIIWLGLA